jgi:transcription elongation factor Elf1
VYAMKCKRFSRYGWVTVCPYCGSGSVIVPSNAGYVLCSICGEWSYNEEYDEFKG